MFLPLLGITGLCSGFEFREVLQINSNLEPRFGFGEVLKMVSLEENPNLDQLLCSWSGSAVIASSSAYKSVRGRKR